MRTVATWLMTLTLAVPLAAPIAGAGSQDPESTILLVSNSGDPADPGEETSAEGDATAASTASLPPAPIYRIPKGVGKERSTIGSGRRGGYSRPGPGDTLEPDDVVLQGNADQAKGGAQDHEDDREAGDEGHGVQERRATRGRDVGEAASGLSGCHLSILMRR